MARTPALPRITIAAELFDHLEALAEGALHRQPDLADRLLTELSRARVVPEAKLPADVVSLGNRVTYLDEATGRSHTLSLVFPEEADIDAGRVSVMTPIGVALLGLPKGAHFTWETRAGEERRLTVLEVEPAPAPA